MDIRKLKEALLDVVFPPRCVSCQRPGAWFCSTCQAQVAWVSPPVCLKCGKQLLAGVSCRACQNLQIDGIRSVAYSEGALREAIHEFKYRGVRALARPLGDLLCAYWREHRMEADLLLAVPLHPRRVRERGYNQSLLLAERLGEGVGLPVDANALRRVRYTRPQVGLDAEKRRQNVAEAFECDASLRGRRVLLIDDVCTTGSTLEACSHALKRQGVQSVWALTLARAQSLT